MKDEECPFCVFPRERIFYEGALVYGMWDAYPVSPGHALLLPKRHAATWFDATPDERLELLAAVDFARSVIDKKYAPDGYNIGVNIGEAAGQTIFHLHLHVIPRYSGDVPDPRGGVRHVLPAKANYILARDKSEQLRMLPHARSLVAGSDDPLLPHILAMLDGAISADIVVAFVMESGMRQIIEHLRDLLERGGRLRFLTGDYLDVTDPQALLYLLDLEGNKELRVFETGQVSFHPKTYIFHSDGNSGVAYVGSSNLSAMAMGEGIEWNYRVLSSLGDQGFRNVTDAFESLFRHESTLPLDNAWVESYAKRRTNETHRTIEIAPELPANIPEPHSIQIEALNALDTSRKAGNTAGLVVLATGLGKTWLSAFDSCQPAYKRILFVAHREEILSQAMTTFRRIRPLASMGRFSGDEKFPDAEIVFASIQTLGRRRHLKNFQPDAFDYIIVDEFHHAAARTYRNLIDHFAPAFLLGLTATPERTDGGDLLSLCQENLVYRCDLAEGIKRDLLAPFRYFGVPDLVDYANIPWRSARFDEDALTTAVATEARANNAFDQHRKKGGAKTLAFCCSQRHADFMSEYFNRKGLRTVAVHSGPSSAPRAFALERLESGELDVVFAVDMFNEGVDLPDIDTIMMLRPTESRVLWLQQFGRGLRKKSTDKKLTVIDYIGNHRIFLLKPKTLLGLGNKDADVAYALERLQKGSYDLPPGCEVTYELEAIDILQKLIRRSEGHEAMRAYYTDFREREGIRPTASEAFHDGYIPRNTRASNGSWFKFVKSMSDLSNHQDTIMGSYNGFFDMLEITPMTKSYKMLTLLAMLAADKFPGTISLDDLTLEFMKIVARSAALQKDTQIEYTSRQKMQTLLIKNPIKAWSEGDFFIFDGNYFSSRITVKDTERETFIDMAREIIDWRLAEYLQRETRETDPIQDALQEKAELTLWRPYMRDKIPGLFGMEFSIAVWNVGFVSRDSHLFLLVTIENKSFTENYQYKDRFISPEIFQWQCQNQTKQSSMIGQRISRHREKGIFVHLFVRRGKKIGKNAAPFYYCGDVDFIDWDDSTPITVRWRLKDPVPESLRQTWIEN